MDKNAISTYGLSAVTAIILVILIVFARPFGSLINNNLNKNSETLVESADAYTTYDINIYNTIYGNPRVSVAKTRVADEVTIIPNPYDGYVYNGANIFSYSGETLLTLTKDDTTFEMPAEPVYVEVIYAIPAPQLS